MQSIPPEIMTYVKYGAPPVVGAVIGYVTNRVAIRMLFRPLVAWKIWKFRVPMTPGVIPSKRRELAFNMGEVVGDHLLTSVEVAKGLEHESFQNHLLALINGKIDKTLEKDLGPLSTTVPKQYHVYLELGTKAITYQIHSQINSFLHSPGFVSGLEGILDRKLDDLAGMELATVLPGEKRQAGYEFIETGISRLLHSESMEQWIGDFVYTRIQASLRQGKSLADILPPSVPGLLVTIIESQAPVFLKHLASIVSEPEVRDKVVKGACGGVEKFIDSLGSMADMVRGFLRMEMVESKILEYLDEKNDDIISWLQSGTLQEKFVAVLREQGEKFLNRPVIEWLKLEDEGVVEEFCQQCTRQLLLMIREEEVARVLAEMLESHVENYISDGSTLGSAILDILGPDAMATGRGRARKELLDFIQSPDILATLDHLIQALVTSLLKKRIGKLSRFVPRKVSEGLAQSIQRQASVILAAEIPGLVESLNIRRIVTDKINSLDLLRLERLLLSIMEEQFKYINLFGALLGFLIGCLNLIVIYGL
jgi:uncharacterized membrane protein YheB (UPF0754 family)